MRQPVEDTDFLKTARDRWKWADDVDTKQAQRERDDIAFEDGDQWPADIKLARQGQQPNNGMPAVPARPTLVIDKVKEPVRQILNQERQSDIGIELVPADDFGDLGITPDDTEVTLREGLVRRIQRESKAADARTWAFKRAVIAGRGYYLVMTRYLPGASWDQDIYLHRIFNQAGVLLDPAHEQPDGSDADWGFIGTWLPWERYKAEYGTLGDGDGNPFSNYGDSEFIGLAESYPDWYQNDGERRAVRVVDYWYTERMQKQLALLEDGSAMWEDEVPEGVEPLDTRLVVEKTIKFCKIGGGVQVLEQTDWAGPDMPIIKVLGDEVLPYDGERRVNGIIRPARDAQMGYNYMVSKQVETIGLTPIAPLMVDPEAIEGYEQEYAVANTRTIGTLKYRTYNDEGKELRPPMRPPVDGNIMPVAQSVNLFDMAIKSTTAVPDSTLGNVDPSLKSGRAIREVVANAQLSTSNFLDNLTRSVRYEAQVINNLLYPIYGAKPGRLVRIVTGEGESQSMQITDPEQQQQQAMQQAKAAKVAKLTKDAHFNVAVKITKSFATRREQIVSMLGQVVAADPMQMAVAGDILYKSMDIPEHKELAERMRVMLAPPIQKMLAAKEQGQQFDPAAQAQIEMLSKENEMAKAAIGELTEEVKGKRAEFEKAVTVEQIKQQGENERAGLEFERARIESDRDIKLAELDNAAKMYIADLNAKTKGFIQAQELEHEAIALDHAQQHDAEQADLDRQGLERQTEQAQMHDAAMAGGAQQHQSSEAERARQAQPQEGA